MKFSFSELSCQFRRSPRKGKLGEGVGCEVADWGVGQELHHLKIWKKVKVRVGPMTII